MSEVKFKACDLRANAIVVQEHDFDRVTAERDALQQRLTAADQEIDDLRAELKAVRLAPCKMIVGDELP